MKRSAHMPIADGSHWIFIFFKCVGGGLYHHWFVFLSFYKAKGGKQLDPKEDSFHGSCVVSREVFSHDLSDRTVGFSPAAQMPLTQPEQQYVLAPSCQPVWQPCPLLPT